MNKVLFLFIALSTLSFGQNPIDSNGHNYEHIVSYHSDVYIQKDCSVKIKETIEVLAKGDNISHGIFRELPLSYAYRGGKVNVGFELMSIKLDGEVEEFHTESFSNGIRIYAGSASRYVSEGIHKYEIEYEVNHVLGLYENFDEISWNINGNGWEFTIDSISANVYLPEKAEIKQFYAYTGVFGSIDQNYTSAEIEGGVQFIGTKEFSYNENMTVAVAWEKGVMIYPTAWEKFVYFIKSYILWVIGSVGLIIAFLINFSAWYRYGRDPKPGTIIPMFYAPEYFSPAECIYVKKLGRSSGEMFGAMLISLAVKGMLKIEANKKDDAYFIKRTEENPLNAKFEMNEIETSFFHCLFLGEPELNIKKSEYNSSLVFAKMALVKGIEDKLGERYHKRNRKVGRRHFIMPFIIAALGGLSFAFMGGAIAIIIVAIVLTMIMNVVFIRLYEQPTKEGRKKMDEITGFEMYMKYADQNRIKTMNPPTMDFEHFEKNLPYAIALGVAKEWAGKFDIPELKEENFSQHIPYLEGMSITSIGNLGSEMSHTISSALTPPASSSSSSSGSSFSSGGGFSGGGGGGGGGGGW